MTPLAYQHHSLHHVSRTFALTIPQLPAPLDTVVGNAYLLCRIADTIEDDTALTAAEKDAFARQFVTVVAGTGAAQAFADALVPRLGQTTTAAERDLICHTPLVLELTHGFSPAQQQSLLRCVRIMSGGMAEFQRRASRAGLTDVAELDRYCYYVAGVVGEMLMELFCDHCPAFAVHGDAVLRPLAVAFGQGLQMTNILKDIWDDQRRGVCWLPQAVFAPFNLADLTPAQHDPHFAAGLRHLVALAHQHLCAALRYILYLPPTQPGLRRFCLWALGMALLTLRRIHTQPDFTAGQAVKISRREVKRVILLSNAATRHDWAVRILFTALARGLP